MAKKAAPVLEAVRVLALDPGTTTGFAYTLDRGETRRWGTVNFQKAGKFRAARILAAEQWLIRKIRDLDPDYIVYETPNVSSPYLSMAAKRSIVAFNTVTELAALKCNIPVFETHSGTLKKFATGKGNAKKAVMMDAAIARGWKVRDDNECDALWLLDHFLAGAPDAY